MNLNEKKIRARSLVLPLLLLGVAGDGPTALAQSAGTFTATASMTVARGAHTAILLPDGRVLVAGGVNNLNTAELYDPLTGTFTRTGDMTTGRRSHTATLLPDGRVLIMGGAAANGMAITTAELYHPSTGTFTPTGGTSSSSARGAATLLPNGKVLFAGLPNAELYDPLTGAFTAAGMYAGPSPGNIQTATLLADGKVLVTGWAASFRSGWSQLYDPASDTFSPTGLMTMWSDDYTATLLLDGTVVFEGNYENDGNPADAELYDTATGTFTRLGSTIGRHQFSTATLVPDGTVLIAGGQLAGGSGDRDAEIYVPGNSGFARAGADGNMTVGRHLHTATLLPEGTVLIAGGYSAYPTQTSTAELYTPAVLVPAPVLLSLSGDGQGQGAIWHALTGEISSPESPAVAGEVLSMYTTLAHGGVIPPQVVIAGRLAEILYFGDAPGYFGYAQVNFRVPNGVAPGSTVSVRLTYLGRSSNEVTIGVR